MITSSNYGALCLKFIPVIANAIGATWFVFLFNGRFSIDLDIYIYMGLFFLVLGSAFSLWGAREKERKLSSLIFLILSTISTIFVVFASYEKSMMVLVGLVLALTAIYSIDEIIGFWRT